MSESADGEASAEPVAEATAEQAKRALTIRIGSQSFVYTEGDQVVRTGPISSGREGHSTPRGTFSVLSKQKDKVSSRYTNQLGWQAWMPYSIQFYGHYFLHEAGFRVIRIQPAACVSARRMRASCSST